MKAKPTFGSAFAGIGGFELGLELAGWECKWQIENDKFCNKVLEERWPDVKRYGGIEDVEIGELGAVDLVCGGFPCQDLSVAGKRKGLSGGRSGLFWELVRLVRGLRPRWVIIENVPGFLSSNQGEDFALALETLAECGYGLAWRVLDSQHFGVPQRRRRVFVVGHLGAPCPPEILFEPEGGEGDIAEGGKAGEDVAYCLRERPSHSGDKGDGGLNTTLIAGFSAGQSAEAGSIAYEEERSPTLRGEPSGTNQVPTVVYGSKDPDIAPTLRSPDPNAPRGPDGKRRDGGPGEKIPIIAFESRIRGDDGRGYEREPRIRDDGIAWTIQAASPGNVCAGAEGDPDGGGLRQSEDRGGRQADAGGEPDERQADGDIPGVEGYEIWGGSKRKDRPEGGFYAKPTDKARPLDTTGGGDGKAQGGTFILSDPGDGGEEADPEGVREAPGVPGRVDLSMLGFRNLEVQRDVVRTLMGYEVLFVSENQRAELRLTPHARQLTGGGGKPGQGYPAVLIKQGGDTPVPTADKTGTLDTGGAGSPKAHGGAWPGYKAQDSDKGFLVLDREHDIELACPCPDSPRYRALGNAVTVQVAEWVGRRILGWHVANP